VLPPSRRVVDHVNSGAISREDQMEDLFGSLLAWIPAFVLLIPSFWFLFRFTKATRKENAEFRERSAQFWDKTLALQSESNQLMRELLAELRPRT
jgi:hypothetical protein